MESDNGSHIRVTSSLVNFPTYLHHNLSLDQPPPDGVKRGGDDDVIDPKQKLKRRKTDDEMPENGGTRCGSCLKFGARFF